MRPITAGQLARMQDTTEGTFTQTATRRRYPLIRDDYGNLERDPDNVDELADVPVTLWQESAAENVADRDQQSSKWLARVPVGTDVTGRDELEVDGTVFAVVGAPLDAGTHLRLELELVSG